MPQRDLLLPWRTIIENIMLAAEIQKDLHITKEEARMWLDRVGLLEYEHALPKQLSGGMRQRAAFLRSLVDWKRRVVTRRTFWCPRCFNKKRNAIVAIIHLARVK